MEKNLKYQKWIDKNTKSLEGKLVVFIGATGSIGYKALEYILNLKASVIIGARNIEKASKIKIDLLSKYPNASITLKKIDVSSIKSINEFLLEMKEYEHKIDYFINNAGVYHLPKGESIDGIEIHFATNCLGAGILLDNMLPLMNENGKIIYTSSISYRFSELDYNDIEGLNIDNKLKKYGLTKRAMLMNTIFIKENNTRKDVSINLCHPGICATELFQKGYSKLFMKVIFPIMKVVFHSPSKASLSIVDSLFVTTKENEWVGPRGLFDAWGFPKVERLKKDVMDLSECEIIHNFIESKASEKK